jgi:hypothetical protein
MRQLRLQQAMSEQNRNNKSNPPVALFTPPNKTKTHI